jgi:hypothetical protein
MVLSLRRARSSLAGFSFSRNSEIDHLVMAITAFL